MNTRTSGKYIFPPQPTTFGGNVAASPARRSSGDALRQAVVHVLASPGLAARWQALFALWVQVSDSAFRARLLAAVSSLSLPGGDARYHQGVFMLMLTEEPRWLVQAARALAMPLTPRGDRLMSLRVLIATVGLTRCHSHMEMATLWGDAGLRELCDRSSASLALANATLKNTQWSPSAEIRKVAIVTDHLGGPHHPPTRLCIDHAALLGAMGMQVALMSAQDYSVHGTNDNAAIPIVSPFTPPDGAGLAKSLPEGALVRIADIAHTHEQRWHTLSSELNQWRPDLVLFVGLMSPVITELRAHVPVAVLPPVSVAPVVPCDVWLCSDIDAAPSLWQAANPGPDGLGRMPSCVAYPARSHAPASVESGAVRSKADFGCAADRVLLVSVGNRLFTEISGRWSERMHAWLAVHPAAHWLLVGRSALQGFNDVSSQLWSLPYQHDLPSVLAACDVFVNPPRVGGGVSVASAMACGLPIVTFSGSDGGVKVGRDRAVDDEQSYFEYLDRLYVDAALRVSEGKHMRARFESELNLRNAAPLLRDALQLAAQSFRRRRSAEVRT